MKKLVCINAKDSDLIQDEIYHLEDVVGCDVCNVTAYILFESKPLPPNAGLMCFKCKQPVDNPSRKMPYDPDRFVELDELDISELVDIIQEENPVLALR